MRPDPLTGAKLAQMAAVEPARMMIIDVFQAGRGIPQFGDLQQPCEAAVLAQRPLLIDEQAQPVFESQTLRIGLEPLRVQPLGHAV